MSEPPPIVFDLLRVAWEHGTTTIKLRKTAGYGSRWCAEIGNARRVVILAPSERPRKQVPDDAAWLIEKYPPPKKPLSIERLEVSL